MKLNLVESFAHASLLPTKHSLNSEVLHSAHTLEFDQALLTMYVCV